jgi:hypothetical protein
LLLGNCHEVELQKITGQNQTAAGRIGQSDGNDWPKEMEGMKTY